jgi:hypothetical protein
VSFKKRLGSPDMSSKTNTTNGNRLSTLEAHEQQYQRRLKEIERKRCPKCGVWNYHCWLCHRRECKGKQ